MSKTVPTVEENQASEGEWQAGNANVSSKAARQRRLSGQNPRRRSLCPVILALALVAIVTVLAAWESLHSTSNEGASGKNGTSAVLEITVLVFREGLECILVVAALTASFKGPDRKYYRPVGTGVAVALVATLATWWIAARVLDDLSENLSALAVQAGTGLLAVLVLLVVMNWFFHKLYWTGWISLHNRRKQELLEGKEESGPLRLLSGMALLGFTSFYREGFEVVLFLQSYRLKLGGAVVLAGLLLGTLSAGAVGAATFFAQHRLPYRKMLIATGGMLAVVLIVMAGEQAQEMQLAHWLPVTEIPSLSRRIPAWLGLWFSVFPTVETLAAQALAGALVFGSYFTARRLPGMSR